MCLFKVNSRGTRKLCKLYSKLTTKTPEVGQEHCSAIYSVKFKRFNPLLEFFFEHAFLTLLRRKPVLVFTKCFLENGHLKHSPVLSPSVSVFARHFCIPHDRSFYIGIVINLLLSVFVVAHGKML